MRAIETLPDAHGHFGVYGGMFVPETLMTALHELAAEYERLIEVFRAHDIAWFFYNGGGDSADTCLKIAQVSAHLGEPIIAVHVPKTVDNDLPITNCCPGFGSVAKYVAISMREAARSGRGSCAIRSGGRS